MRKLKLILIFLLITVITGCKSKEDAISPKKLIEDNVTIINDKNYTIYSNFNNLDEIGYTKFDKVEDVQIEDELTFIVWDLEQGAPTENEYTLLKDIFNTKDQSTVVLYFFGRIDEEMVSHFLTEEELNSPQYEDISDNIAFSLTKYPSTEDAEEAEDESTNAPINGGGTVVIPKLTTGSHSFMKSTIYSVDEILNDEEILKSMIYPSIAYNIEQYEQNK